MRRVALSAFFALAASSVYAADEAEQPKPDFTVHNEFNVTK